MLKEKKQEFYLQYSPALTISYRRAAKTILANGSVHDRQKFSDTKLYENIESRLFTMTSEDSKDGLVTEDVRCMLTTKFNHQWTRIKVQSELSFPLLPSAYQSAFFWCRPYILL